MIDFELADKYYGYGAEEAVRNRQAPPPSQALCPLVTVVGGSGGVGRSSLALLLAALCARKGIDCSLFEADLQFGDYGVWMGLEDTMPTVGTTSNPRSIELADHLGLFKAPLFPEEADQAVDVLSQQLPLMRCGTGLMIADTGTGWTGLTAELLQSSDVFILMVDQRRASLAAAVKASELCARLGVPSTRMVVVYNRWSPKAQLKVGEVRAALGVNDVACIPDGKACVEQMLAQRNFMNCLDPSNAVVEATGKLLDGLLPRVGCLQTRKSRRRR